MPMPLSCALVLSRMSVMTFSSPHWAGRQFRTAYYHIVKKLHCALQQKLGSNDRSGSFAPAGIALPMSSMAAPHQKRTSNEGPTSQ
jgi:hypothetical protein